LSYRKRQNAVLAGNVGGGGACEIGAEIGCGDRQTGDDSGTRIANDSQDGACDVGIADLNATAHKQQDRKEAWN